MSYSEVQVLEDLMMLHKLLTLDTPAEHVEPLQLTPPVSLEYLGEKLEVLDIVIYQVGNLINRALELVCPRFCIPPESSKSDVYWGYWGNCNIGIDLGDDDKKEWTDSIKLWNEGTLSVVEKIEAMKGNNKSVDDALEKLLSLVGLV
ncbi:MAG: hypothetical protein L6R37_008304 [Teloschistes peruensis]|nr:MAG: hypothetical protein L6R37_008304 [Teloschistes peruensis]